MTEEQYYSLIHPYTDAMNLVLTRLEVLNHKVGEKDEAQPIHGITSRIKGKDYIHNPKPNGYRSYHLIVGVPIYYIDRMEYYPVEIQFRTISMDFWAAMEHRICYKNQPFDELEMRSAFLQYSEILERMEKSFEVYSENNREQ